MTGREDQAEEIVADVVVEPGVDLGPGRFPATVQLAAQLGVLPLEHLVAAEEVDGPPLSRRHEPGPGIVRDSGFRPPHERGQQRVLGQVLGDTDVAYDTRETGDEPGGLDPPDRFDGAMDVGSRHGPQSGHLQPGEQVCPYGATSRRSI